MCMSPHEMTTASIEETIAFFNARLEEDPTDTWRWKWRIEEFEKILKERAEAGIL